MHYSIYSSLLYTLCKIWHCFLLHHEVYWDDSCLAFQLSALHPLFLQSSGGCNACDWWGHCTFTMREEAGTPHCPSDLLFVCFASPARDLSSITLTCRSIAWLFGIEGRDYHLVCRHIPLEVWLHHKQGEAIKKRQGNLYLCSTFHAPGETQQPLMAANWCNLQIKPQQRDLVPDFTFGLLYLMLM